MEQLTRKEAPMEDQGLIAGLKRGDENALSSLCAQYTAYAATIIRNIGRGSFSNEDVEELIADVFIALWRNGERIIGPSLRPYLAQAARNMAITLIRKRKAEPLPFDDEILVLSKEDAPDDALLQQEQSAILNEAVGNMGVPDREIFIRFYYYHESIEEISRVLQMQPSTIKSRLRRGRMKLKNAFIERGYRYEE